MNPPQHAAAACEQPGGVGEQWRFVRAAQESNQLGMTVLKPRRMRAR